MDSNAEHEQVHSLVLGSRASQLALVQTELVQSALGALYPSTQISVSTMTTAGDKDQSQALYLIGGKALWTKELEVALLEQAVDVIVHSLKDMPTTLPRGCELVAIIQREDPRDCFVAKSGSPYKSLADLPAGSVVGTSSVRRVAQLKRAFPELKFADVRGNLNTRLRKLDADDSPFEALILATAGLKRIGLGDRVTAPLERSEALHAVGQGALGIEMRSRPRETAQPALDEMLPPPLTAEQLERDRKLRKMVRRIGDWQTTWKCVAEREMLRVLEGGCSVPVGCWTELTELPQPSHVMPAMRPRMLSSLSTLSVSSSGSTHSSIPEFEDSDEEEQEEARHRRVRVSLQGVITSLDGQTQISTEQSKVCTHINDCLSLGHDVALELIQKGGKAILESLGRSVSTVEKASRSTQRKEHKIKQADMTEEVFGQPTRADLEPVPHLVHEMRPDA
ncbi:uncharacterized protein L969DRAFT_51375 [Mixia osmundae IAM 14324]|uniref:Porphobilinogen deaminase n=1 Tax=Mixia osmundae (strain CBS 9802 / IAM 14324 / JCM 22182 / KY 12970) TaxID=764103 RepID=G7E7T6_MIXOS|nr:uncharacterized protein L969DRAFT_51375 [Mixia osmundae IAM 14324]KEI38497.1 hypothetical protein L969DRAFT_51375 [Mixia osmundae IAM 14324]GAA98896.1 hypothetical protein E5Q_05584 [Mixia osmundae IAM 14324]